MSGKLRKETNCLNCGAEVTNKYCGHCGQENTVHPESVAALAKHFFQDFTHFDSKFFRSMFLLFSQPGMLTNEYNQGRRKKFINPVRMYIFVSVVVFSYLFFQTSNLENLKLRLDDNRLAQNDNKDTIAVSDNLKFTIGGKPTDKESWRQDLDSVIIENSVKPGDGILTRNIKKVVNASMSSFQKNPDEYTSKFLGNFLHNLPKTLLICLPFFALLLYAFHFRKKPFLIEHVIFSIHFHIFLLLSFLIMMMLSKAGISVLLLMFLAALGSFIYLFLAMRKVYADTKPTTFLKELLLVSVYSIIILGVQVLNIIISLSSSHI